MLSGIQERLQGIEEQLQSVPALPPPGFGTIRSMHTDTSELAERINSMEKLLFRMPFDDYTKLDHVVEKVLAVGKEHFAKQDEETETLPSTPENEIMFDIFEVGLDKMTQTEWLEHGSAGRALDEDDQTSSLNVATQTQAMPRPRKSRVNGRATQTTQTQYGQQTVEKKEDIEKQTSESEKHISEGGGADPLLPAPTGEVWSKNRTAMEAMQDGKDEQQETEQKREPPADKQKQQQELKYDNCYECHTFGLCHSCRRRRMAGEKVSGHCPTSCSWCAG